jgi:hypothetical protein
LARPRTGISLWDNLCDEARELAVIAIRAAPHFVDFFVPRFFVYASSQYFVGPILGQPYLDIKRPSPVPAE